MKQRNKLFSALSFILSLMMILSVISIPSFKAKAAGTVDDFVERCYTVTLDRGSDSDGFADWKGQLLNGKSVGTNIAYGFLFSAEYKNKNKSDEDYVKDLYMLFMGREADEGGFNDWVGKLKEGKSREEVFAGFANSKEFYNLCEEYGITAGYYAPGFDRNQVNNVNLFVERLYQTCLGRRGDRDGQKDWVSKLLNKQITGIECARSFVQSKEYVNKSLSNENFVENMYLAMMGRASDEEGKNNWITGLENGMTRDEVFAGFANSKEFGNICETYKINKGSYTANDKGTFNPNISNKSNFKVGDIVKFGKYEQDDNISNGKEDIEWQILKVEEGRILVVSKYALTWWPYNNTPYPEAATWETCTIRNWLNNDFYNEIFSSEEKNKIPSVTVVNNDNPLYGTYGGNNTIDKVFCLSLEEVESYFGEYNFYSSEYQSGLNQNLICTPTQYALNRGPYSFDFYMFTEEEYEYYKQYGYTEDLVGRYVCPWYLRTIGKNSDDACIVYKDGTAGADMCFQNRSIVAIRPAMYIEY